MCIRDRLSVFCYSLGLYLWDRAAQKTIRDIRDRMFAHVNRLGVDYFDRRRSGDTTSRLINDCLLYTSRPR